MLETRALLWGLMLLPVAKWNGFLVLSVRDTRLQCAGAGEGVRAAAWRWRCLNLALEDGGAGAGIALKLVCHLKLALQGKSCDVGNGAEVMGTEPPEASKQEVWGSWVWLGLGGSTAGGQGAPWCGGEPGVLLHFPGSFSGLSCS